MKKLLYILGFLMFATSALQPVVTFGQDQFSKADEDVPFSTARLFSKLVESTGLDPNADWTTTFGEDDDEDVGQDLYLIIYNKTELQPQNQAAKETAGKYALTQGELNLVISGDYSVISDRKPGLRQEELQAKVLQIREDFTWRKDMNELKAQVKAQVETNEIFANGDLGDSGFDLIHDLEIIEELLFLHTSPIDIGSSYTSTSGLGLAQVGQAGGTQAAITGPDGTKGPGQVGSSLTESDSNDSDSEGTAEGSSSDLNPNACFADESYLEALEKFEENAQNDANYKDGSAQQEALSGEGPALDDENTGTNQQALNDFLPPLPEPDLSNLQPAAADDWSKDKLCNDVFCLQVNYVEKPATSAYANSDNCIACHVEKINDVLKTVVSHTLAPSKAPGNLGESAQCKKAIATAFGSVSMNFYAISMPVQTPTNDDLIFGTSIEDEWQQFCNDVAFFPFDSCKSPEEVVAEIENGTYEPAPLLIDRATKQAISQLPDGASQAEVAKRIDETITGYELQSKEAAIKLIAQRKTDESLIFFNPLLTEMDQMNYYFSKIQIVLHSLHEEVDGFPGKQACTDLKNKKECQ